MTSEQIPKDLVILVADKNMEFTIKGLLSRPKALGVRFLANDLFVHPEQDTGCLLRSHDFLRSFINRYAHALVMLDREGCGREGSSREVLEREVEDRLSRSGWGNRAVAIVLDPELEIWVWSDSPHVDSVLGWEGKQPDLKTWLRSQGFWDAQRTKPDRPKEAVEEALRLARKARSSSNYFQLAQRVGFGRCTDPAFLKLKAALQDWFSEEPP
ncbi:MAG: hypothetical protein HYY20_02180 [Candidatus Tectomicrobia bacterium]|uniref:DUF4276 family protein n=1 Tax=Tectimicrobiota bacterium TaxID=2528274 RepID=A0A932CM97_UNCTE|nr:hypothetical protein [Candidatus Tectomicrobia bacterium]